MDRMLHSPGAKNPGPGKKRETATLWRTGEAAKAVAIGIARILSSWPGSRKAAVPHRHGVRGRELTQPAMSGE